MALTLNHLLEKEKVVHEISAALVSQSLKFPFFRRISPAGVTAQPEPEMILDSNIFLSSQSTLIFQNAELYIPSIRSLSDCILEKTGKHTNTNIYFSSPHAKGFGRHCDADDSYIVQVSGSKNWSIWENFVQQNFVLREHGIKFIPKGVDHEVTATESRSIHLNIKMLASPPIGWREQGLESTGLRSFGHLNPNKFNMQHPILGVLDSSVYSDEYQLEGVKFSVINWKKFDHYRSKGFLIHETATV